MLMFYNLSLSCPVLQIRHCHLGLEMVFLYSTTSKIHVSHWLEEQSVFWLVNEHSSGAACLMRPDLVSMLRSRTLERSSFLNTESKIKK
jgi:hypothetical protein